MRLGSLRSQGYEVTCFGYEVLGYKVIAEVTFLGYGG